LIQFLFWSGLRIGESAATNASYADEEAGVLRVDWQIDDKGKKRLPKYDKRRKTHIPRHGFAFLKKWIAAKDRDQLDRQQATKILKKFCKEIFVDPINHISLHGLRHSYAHLMLRHFDGPNGKRFSLDDVADFLGDHPWTAKKFYAGMIPDKIAFERAKEITDVGLIA